MRAVEPNVEQHNHWLTDGTLCSTFAQSTISSREKGQWPAAKRTARWTDPAEIGAARFVAASSLARRHLGVLCVGGHLRKCAGVVHGPLRSGLPPVRSRGTYCARPVPTFAPARRRYLSWMRRLLKKRRRKGLPPLTDEALAVLPPQCYRAHLGHLLLDREYVSTSGRQSRAQSATMHRGGRCDSPRGHP